MKERQYSFDIVKLFMMLWVVWGHLGSNGIVQDTSSVLMHNAKVGVNMPVFFVISGYFAALTFDKADWSKVIARAATYIWPDIAIPGICALFWVFAVGDDMMSAIGHVHFYWFLRTLFVVYLICAAVCKCSVNIKSRWLLFICLYIAMPLAPVCMRFGVYGMAIHMLPYFVFGLMVLRRHPVYRNAVISVACGAVFLIAVFLQGDSKTNGMNFWLAEPYWNVVFSNFHNAATFVFRAIVGISGSIFVLFLAEILVGRFPAVRCLAPFGLTTLGVYVLHEYPLILVGRYVAFPPAPAWSRWLVALGWFLVCHYAVCAIMHFRFCRFVLFGDERCVKSFVRLFSCACRRLKSMKV